VCSYVFLVERVHVVRAPYVGRSQDRIYIGCTLFMIAAFTGVVINAWIHPYTKMYASDGRCHMGIIKKVTIPFLLIDILMDIVLTGVFVYLLRPTIKDNGLSNFPSIFNTKRPCETSPTPPTHRESRKTTVQRSIRKLLRKSIIGALLITVPTVALFFVQYYVVEGKGPAFVCSTICLVDGNTTPIRPSNLNTDIQNSILGLHCCPLAHLWFFGSRERLGAVNTSFAENTEKRSALCNVQRAL